MVYCKNKRQWKMLLRICVKIGVLIYHKSKFAMPKKKLRDEEAQVNLIKKHLWKHLLLLERSLLRLHQKLQILPQEYLKKYGDQWW